MRFMKKIYRIVNKEQEKPTTKSYKKVILECKSPRKLHICVTKFSLSLKLYKSI